MAIRSTYFIPGLHVLVWAIVLLIPAIVLHNIKLETGLPNGFFYTSNLYHIGLFYLNAYFLYPRFLTSKRWWLYVLLIVALIIISGQGKLFLLRLLDPSFVLTPLNERIIFFLPVLFLGAATVFRFVLNRIRFERLEKERKAERLASELKFLRSQISPHFLFNVLTNMVSLARKNSAMLEPALIQLSDMLRYMLYETGDGKFPVEKGIDYLRNYIELQQLRFGEDVKVQMDIRNEQDGCSIEPLLLIPFVENAFKHGIGMVKDPFIKIEGEIKEQHLFFRVSNNYNRQNLSKDKNSGIGIANVKTRLDLLYGKNYELQIDDNGEIYRIELNLDLTC